MKKLNQNDLLQIEGGINISGTLINSFSSIIKIILEVGRSIGSAFRRFGDDTMCNL